MSVPAIPADYFDGFIAKQLAKQQDRPPMSTEADIVETVRLLRKDGMQTMWGANSLLCKAANLIEELTAERDAAARDMRERCAKIAEEMALNRRTAENKRGFNVETATPAAKAYWCEEIADAIRTLPDSAAPTDFVIATEGDSHG